MKIDKAYKINWGNSIQNSKYARTIFSCKEIISFLQKCRDIRFMHDIHKTGSYTVRLWGTTNLRGI